MAKQQNPAELPSIKPGDFVRQKGGSSEPIGVVWDVHPRNAKSVEVYHPVNGKTRTPKEYAPEELVVVPAHEVSEALVKFKASMQH